MAEENVSQVKEMIPDEHCCIRDAEIIQETSVETMPPLMVEDVLLPPPHPPAAVSNGNVNPRRHSTGALGKAQAQTRYRGNQTSSTHDLCKHGKRREEDLVVKPWKLVKKKDVEGESLSSVRKSLQVAKRDAAASAATSEVVKSSDGLQRAKRSETKSSVTQSDSPAGGVRMAKKTNLDVKKSPRISESKSSKEDLVKSLRKKEKKTETDELVRCDDAVEKKAKEDLVKSLKKKEKIDETVRCDDVSEKTLYVVESSIEEKKVIKKKKIITSVKSEIQQSSVKKILRQRTPTLIPSLSPSSQEVKEPRVTKSDPRPIRKTTSRSKTSLSEKKEIGSATLVTKPKRIGLKVTPASGPPTRPVSFRKGKVLEPKQEDSTPTSIKFKKRIVQEPKLRSDGNKKKKSLKKDVGKVSSYNSGEGKREKVVLRHRKVEAKKKLQTLFNNVIEETVNKLEEVRKSKVKALVGAFETVISLQDNDMTSQKKKKVQSKSTSSQVVEG
ncbi:unnamed protein product [Brassica oleracea]